MHVLFLCTGNSCRSILGEATFNHLAPPGWHAMSAGSHPTGTVHPRSLALLQREGISTEGLHSKSWDGLPVTPDVVITVCASAAGETCPAYLGPVLRTHWGVDDPAHVTGTDEVIDRAFATAYRTLRAAIRTSSRTTTRGCSSRDRSSAGSSGDILVSEMGRAALLFSAGANHCRGDRSVVWQMGWGKVSLDQTYRQHGAGGGRAPPAAITVGGTASPDPHARRQLGERYRDVLARPSNSLATSARQRTA